MAIKSYKPTTNGRRGMTTLVNEEITKTTPEKSLVVTLKKNGGRNNTGRITVRHQGGGAKRKYRIIDFKRDKDGVIGTVTAIEYDPNRSANIALITYADGEKRYIIAPKGIEVGMKIEKNIDNNYEINVENEEQAHTLMKNLVNNNISIDKFELKKPSLNDIFIEKVGA